MQKPGARLNEIGRSIETFAPQDHRLRPGAQPRQPRGRPSPCCTTSPARSATWNEPRDRRLILSRAWSSPSRPFLPLGADWVDEPGRRRAGPCARRAVKPTVQYEHTLVATRNGDRWS
ncbi:hypothetical protein ACRAWD_28490 [Caulobacter segnis]